MTLYDLIESGIVKDEQRITVSKPLQGTGADMRKGNWFNDRILEFLGCEIGLLTWDEKNGWSIALRKEG